MDRYEIRSEEQGRVYTQARVATLDECERLAAVYIEEGAEFVYAMELDADENVIPWIDAAGMWRCECADCHMGA